ncbi:MAG TPA: ABC transporter permease subunit [Candidatus Cybelea sp.]|nr:ABC transporter permease subunit [Candidatus Cybelea sp.]
MAPERVTTVIEPSYRPRELRPTRWDVIAALVVFGLLVTLASEFGELAKPLGPSGPTPITLDPAELPYYAFRTVSRMFLALGVSLLFTFGYATLAAKSRRAERLMVPVLDILQSVPILGYVSVAVTALAAAFPNRQLGYELSAIFALFTSQAWNMTFSLFQSLKTVPEELTEAARSFQLTAWQRFWRLEVPFAVPGLVWNAMMSMSGGWFFIVAAEAISVAGHDVNLPGIGSYIALATAESSLRGVFYAVLAMLFVIVVYDVVIFRPLVAWSERYKAELSPDLKVAQSWVLNVVRRARLMRAAAGMLGRGLEALTAGLRVVHRARELQRAPSRLAQIVGRVWEPLWIIAAVLGFLAIARFVHSSVDWSEIRTAFGLGLLTGVRVFALVLIAAAIWAPIGVWVGLRPRVMQIVQPVAQFLAAFPANLLFPIFASLVTDYRLNPDIWLSPLIVLGTQWYILFNVIAGAAAFPADLKQAAQSLRLKGFLWWWRVMLPGIFPYLITGIITAAGGAWNATVVAEVVSWGQTRVVASGLGSYIANATNQGDFARIALGVAVMALYVTVLNRILWRPLYAMAERRYHIT